MIRLILAAFLSLAGIVGSLAQTPNQGVGVPNTAPFTLASLLPAGAGDVAPSGLVISLCLHRCISTYTGPLVTVVRASDSAVLNLPQDALGNLDQGMCAAFQGTSTLTVSAWFDQTINGNNAVQATSANRPALSCSVPQLGGLPGIYYGPACSLFSLVIPASPSWNGWATGASPGTVLNTEFLAATTASCTEHRWELGGSDPNSMHSLIPGGGSQIRLAPGFSTSDGNFITTQTTGTTLGNIIDYQYQWTLTTNVPTITINGAPTTLATSTAPVGTPGTDVSFGWAIGNADSASSTSFAGYINTFMVWGSGPGATSLEAARKSEGTYYGISVQ